MNRNKHTVICSCESSQHLVVFTKDEDQDELCIEVQLIQHRNIIKRIWTAVKYVFGYKSVYGHWDCTLMNKTEINKLYYWLKRNKDNISD